jgi:6-pyruvoyltetrahydropterin/6-carboxytetrahydropterin synthase
MMTATRKHEIHSGHRVHGHGGKCQHLHGHQYVFTMHCAANNHKLDKLGMVIDFGDIKSRLCEWLEECWDHRFLIWQNDPYAEHLQAIDPYVVLVPFNPTAENIAEYFVTRVAPMRLSGTGITLVSCTVNETSKCSATFTLES